MPKISIIVPVYNAQSVLRRCIESILNQTYDDFEVILINDGSKDKSKEIIDEYKKKDSRVKAIHNSNNGVSETRNIGVTYASGEYIQFIDSDDYIELNMLEETVRLLEGKNSDLVITGLFLDIESKKGINTSIQTFEYKDSEGKENIAIEVMKRLNGTYINSPVNKLYKRTIIIDNNIKMDKDIDLGEDLIFNLEYLKQCNNVVFSNKSYYHYCIKMEESLTAQYREDKLDLMELIYVRCKEYFIYCNVSEDELTGVNNIFIKWMYSCFIDLHNKGCGLTIKEKIIYIKQAKDKYNNIISNTRNIGLMLSILKFLLRYPYMVWIISKIIYILKVKFRQILYK